MQILPVVHSLLAEHYSHFSLARLIRSAHVEQTWSCQSARRGLGVGQEPGRKAAPISVQKRCMCQQDAQPKN